MNWMRATGLRWEYSGRVGENDRGVCLADLAEVLA